MGDVSPLDAAKGRSWPLARADTFPAVNVHRSGSWSGLAMAMTLESTAQRSDPGMHACYVEEALLSPEMS